MLKRLRSAPLALCSLSLSLLALAACDPALTTPHARGPSDVPVFAATGTIPAEGTSSTLDFGTWNIEWFGDTSNGPSNEALQLENVRDAIAMTDLDLWGLQEVVNDAAFDNLVSQLPGYDGFLANDPLVTDGAAYYSDYNGTEQKVGFIYKTGVATLQSARIILTAYNYEFAGRPPLEANFSVTVNGTTESIVVIVLHAKAGAQAADYDRRLAGSEALKSYLDSTYPTQRVIVIGDFNDDVDASIVRSKGASPYANFVNDSADYTFPTGALSAAGISTTVNYSDAVDHHLATNEFMATYVASSAKVLPVEQYFVDYGFTTSDHYPVSTRYTVGTSSGGNTAPTASFTYTCTELVCAFTDGSSDSDGSISSRSWTFGDGGSSTATNPSHTYAAGGTYSVSLTVTDDGGATSSTSQSVSVSSSPSGSIVLSATGYKVKGSQRADLTWSGATSTSVDVYRDGAVVATTPNDGAHTDNINRNGGGSYVYRLCEAGTTVCSNSVTVTF